MTREREDGGRPVRSASLRSSSRQEETGPSEPATATTSRPSRASSRRSTRLNESEANNGNNNDDDDDMNGDDIEADDTVGEEDDEDEIVGRRSARSSTWAAEMDSEGKESADNDDDEDDDEEDDDELVAVDVDEADNDTDTAGHAGGVSAAEAGGSSRSKGKSGSKSRSRSKGKSKGRAEARSRSRGAKRLRESSGGGSAGAGADLGGTEDADETNEAEERDDGDDAGDDVDGDGDSDGMRQSLPPSARRKVGGTNSDEDTDEEVDREVDPKGEAKVTKDGYLLGGREYKLTAFTLPRHPTRLYMFSLEASKVLGFRDTYIFFLRNPNVRRVNGDEADREYLRARGLLPSQLRNRAITLVTARNLFRVFGHMTVKRGKPVRDDYFVGDKEEPAHFEETRNEMDEDSDHAADFVKTLAAADGPFARSMPQISILGFNQPEPPEERFQPTYIPQELRNDNWMLKCALSAAEFNQRLNKYRPTRFFDLHTNIEQVPLITQPEQATVEMRTGSKFQPYTVEKNPTAFRSTDTRSANWFDSSNDPDAYRFPIALLSSQYQAAVPLHRERFKDRDIPLLHNAHTTQPQNKRSDIEAQNAVSDAFKGLVSFKPVAQPESQIRKRDRPREKRTVPTVSGEPKLCCHCNSATATLPEGYTAHVPANLVLECSQCDTNHHPSCIEFNSDVLISKVLTYDWQCSHCKLCTICTNAGDDDKLMFCDTCDRGYHMYCLSPPLYELPEGTWLCPECAVCKSCKRRTASSAEGSADAWHHVIIPPSNKPDASKSTTSTNSDATSVAQTYGAYLCTYCADCYEHFQADRFCPLCMHVYREDSDDLAMVCCDDCERWVHAGCDPELTAEVYQELVEQEDPVFTCALCDRSKREKIMAERTQAGDSTRLSLVHFKKLLLVAPPLVAK